MRESFELSEAIGMIITGLSWAYYLFKVQKSHQTITSVTIQSMEIQELTRVLLVSQSHRNEYNWAHSKFYGVSSSSSPTQPL